MKEILNKTKPLKNGIVPYLVLFAWRNKLRTEVLLISLQLLMGKSLETMPTVSTHLAPKIHFLLDSLQYPPEQQYDKIINYYSP